MTDPPAVAFPHDLPIELDPGVRVVATGRVLVGGDPPRAVRLSGAGTAALVRLRTAGAGVSATAARLARTLVDRGLAHPRPARAAAAGVTVVVPVRDRPDALAGCLAAAGAPAIVVDDGSRDAAAVAAVCAAHGVRLVRLETSVGPGGARNAALAHVDTPLVAFLDSDCVPESGWLESLVGHFADPLVAAVAPRVRAAAGSRAAGRFSTDPPAAAFAPRVCGAGPLRSGPVGRFAAARSPLDLGDRPARVRPGGRVAYVPTAALLVRRAALGGGFDPALRFGEDVDLVWRLHDAGWRVRYDPAVSVHHREPARWRDLATRRYRYGTSAAPLAARHPDRLAPFVVHPWPSVIAALALAGRPRLAVAVAAGRGAGMARRRRPAGVPGRDVVFRPVRNAGETLLAAGRTATMLAPVALLAATVVRRTRGPALVLLAGPPLVEWSRRRPVLDPVRWTALCIADDVAYGAGVWAGCLRARTLRPVLPVIARRGPGAEVGPAL